MNTSILIGSQPAARWSRRDGLFPSGPPHITSPRAQRLCAGCSCRSLHGARRATRSLTRLCGQGN
jgi:hypothetical protein